MTFEIECKFVIGWLGFGLDTNKFPTRTEGDVDDIERSRNTQAQEMHGLWKEDRNIFNIVHFMSYIQVTHPYVCHLVNNIYNNESITLCLTIGISEDMNLHYTAYETMIESGVNLNFYRRSPRFVILDQQLLRSVVQIPWSISSATATFLNDLETEYCN